MTERELQYAGYRAFGWHNDKGDALEQVEYLKSRGAHYDSIEIADSMWDYEPMYVVYAKLAPEVIDALIEDLEDRVMQIEQKVIDECRIMTLIEATHHSYLLDRLDSIRELK